jgi:hypothetical protein
VKLWNANQRIYRPPPRSAPDIERLVLVVDENPEYWLGISVVAVFSVE